MEIQVFTKVFVSDIFEFSSIIPVSWICVVDQRVNHFVFTDYDVNEVPYGFPGCNVNLDEFYLVRS